MEDELEFLLLVDEGFHGKNSEMYFRFLSLTYEVELSVIISHIGTIIMPVTK